MDAALAHVARRAALDAERSRAGVAGTLARYGRDAVDTSRARVTLNFHPDRLRPDGVTVAEGLLHDGRYRSQFETGVTNGSPTAFTGGDRARWEETLFGDAYRDGAERPKYGAFNVMAHSDGGSPRFGSCFVELVPAMLGRCSFTWGDSHAQPAHVGTASFFDGILAAWLDAIETTGAALGASGLDVPGLLSRLADAAPRPAGRALDDYIEAQVHGPIELARDVAVLVVDPSFAGTPTGTHLVALAARYGFAFRYHAGFALRAAEVPPDFRGPRMRPLAERIAGDTLLDAAALGRAARSIVESPERWHDWGTPAATWQHIKQLWHVVVRFGHPA